MAVAVGANAPRHRSIGFRIFEKPARHRDNRLGILADQSSDSGFDRLGPLTFVSHDEDRSSRRRRPSCTPPESVKMITARFIAETNGP